MAVFPTYQYIVDQFRAACNAHLAINEFGEGNEAEYSRIMAFFIIMTIFISIFTYFSGVELSSPGISVVLVFFIVLIASAGGFLMFNSGRDNLSQFVEQYGFSFLFGLIVINYLFAKYRRDNE